MNLNAYGYGPPDNRKWIIVDIGVTFGGANEPGVDVILPDPTYLAEQKENILAIILTHAHEDHIGAIGHLWPRLKAPVYATPFTAALVRGKLKEHGLEGKVKLTETTLDGRLSIGPFEIEYVRLTHSIPEPSGLAIRTPLGLVWHTGDWKIDPEPIIGDVTDDARLRELGGEGVLAMVCDSTNVFVEGEAGSEAGVRDQLIEVIGGCKGKVAVTLFASNVARLDSVVRAGIACGRTPILVGRSMHKITAAAKGVGLLADLPNFMDESDAGYLEPNQLLLLCTGSQGEPRAALSRIAAGDHRHIKLGEGDTVIFSSRQIPGNETAIHDVQNRLVEKGVRLITDRDAHIHVSGHPCRDELKQMYQWARPKIAVPVHGERRHILEHVELARALQTPEAIAPKNGDVIRLAPGPAAVIDEAPAGRLHLDGGVIVEAESEALRLRRRLAEDGQVIVTLVISGKKHTILTGPDIRLVGLAAGGEDEEEELLDELTDVAAGAFNRLSAADRQDEDMVEEVVMKAVRKQVQKTLGKRPYVECVILTV